MTAALAAVLVLAGCSGAATDSPTGAASPSASAAPTTTAPTTEPLAVATAGTASAAVKVSGSAKSEPKVSFPTPTTVTATERTVVTKGSGDEVTEGSTATFAYALYDGKSGKKLVTTGYGSTSPEPLVLSTAQILPGVVEALAGSHVGDRLAAVIPSSKAFQDQGSEQLGIAAGDSLVLVADVIDLVPSKADGAAKALPSGFPKVTLAADGQPTVSIPSADAPTALRIADSKVGTGATVKSGDSVTLQYQGVLWRTGDVFDQSWGKSGPTALSTKKGALVEGFRKALVGQKVGSQVVVIVPPSEGYGDTPPQGSPIGKTDTMVFVIDVLATTTPAS